MTKQLSIRAERCIGCRSCELACSLKNEGILNPSKSRINVITFFDGRYNLPFNIPFTCRQCKDALCLKVCSVNAIFQDNNKTIRVMEEECIGCGRCVKVCPFGAMFFDKDKKKAFKCELCGGRPACVEICPVGVILFKEMKRFISKETVLLIEGYSILSNLKRKVLERKNG